VIPPLRQGDDKPRLDQATVGDEQRFAAVGNPRHHRLPQLCLAAAQGRYCFIRTDQPLVTGIELRVIPRRPVVEFGLRRLLKLGASIELIVDREAHRDRRLDRPPAE
jgi:hypothetical protein